MIATRYAGLLVILVLGFPMAAQCGENDGESLQDRTVLGALSYRIHCLNCHGSSGTGDGPMADLLKIVPADLARLAAENGGEFPAERVYQAIDGRQEIVAHGTREMPVWGIGFQDLGRDDDQEAAVHDKILDLVSFLRSLQIGIDDKDEPGH